MNNAVTTQQTNQWLSKEEKQIIRKQFFPPKATDIDMQYCMSVAQSFDLNPILKQIYFVPRRAFVDGQWVEKIEPLAGRDSFLTLAHRTGKFAGIESFCEIKEKPYLNNGKWEQKSDLVGIAKVYRNDVEKPFIVEVSYNEYVQKKKDGTPTQFWLNMPETMIKKVAESQALRKAFNISGLYSIDEAGEYQPNISVNKENGKPKQDLNQIVKQSEPLDIDAEVIEDKTIDFKGELTKVLISHRVNPGAVRSKVLSLSDSEAEAYLADSGALDSLIEELKSGD